MKQLPVEVTENRRGTIPGKREDMKLTGYRRMIILILAFVITVITPLQAAAAPKKEYVGDLYLAYGDNADEAKQTLTDKGFTPIEGNLNDGGRTYVMLGYKTTDDIRYAITDVAVMNMRGGYSVEDYKTMLREKKSEIAGFLEEFMVVIKEYRANYEAGRMRAVYVHDLLNKYTDDDTGMKLGDLFLADTLQDKVGVQKSVTSENKDNLPDLITILLQGNSDVVKSVELLLAMATDPSDDTWIERFSNLTFDDLLDNVAETQPKLNTEAKQLQYLDNVYGGISGAIAADMVSIRDQLAAYEASGLHMDTATEEDIKKAFGDPDALEGEDAVRSSAAIQDWMATGALYENLKAYEGGRFGKGELLDFFMEETDPDDIERLYPIVASLSEGQWYGLPFVSFDMHLRNAFADEKDWKSQADEAKSTINGLEELSVYANIDRDIYKDDGSVALTDKAIREKNTIDGTTGSMFDNMDALAITTMICYAATAVGVAVTTVSAAYAGFNTIMYYHYDRVAESVLVLDKATGAYNDEYIDIVNNKRDLFINDELHIKGASFAKFAAFATIAIGLISAALTFYEITRGRIMEKQLPIPKYLVDNNTDADGSSYSINYKAVECNREEFHDKTYELQTGNSADIMADEGVQWLALYVSRNSLAGNPILADFAVQKESQAPAGLAGNLHLIGERGAINIASGSFRYYNTYEKTKNLISDKTMYLFYGISDTPKTYDESSGNMTATDLNSGTSALFGFGGMAIGVVLGAVLSSMRRKKQESEAEAA